MAHDSRQGDFMPRVTVTTTDPRTRYADASIKRVTAENGIEYVYRDLGAGGVPLVMLQHFTGTLTTGIPR
jgi:hypothetical protein